MSYNEERGFDEMIHKATPYLLFCYDNDQKIISNLLRSLFSSINNPSSFQENYNELKKILDDIKLEPERNMKFKVFENQYHSLEQRIRNIEGTYLEFKGMIDRIKQDHLLLINHGKRLAAIRGHKQMEGKKNSCYVEPSSDSITSIEKVSKNICSVCGKKLLKKCTNKKTSLDIFYCRKGCKSWYYVDISGKIPVCKKCGKLKAHLKGIDYCPICDKKPEKIGIKYKCPRCNTIGIYDGKTNKTRCKCRFHISDVKKYQVI